MKHTLLFVALLLAACVPGPDVQKLPKWQPKPDVPRYGDWVVDPATCQIHAAATQVKAETSGRIENGLIPVKISFLLPLVRPPLVTLSGMPVPLPLDGSKWNFTTYLAYDSNSAAYMMEHGTFMVITYQPLNTTEAREVHFETRGLLEATVHVRNVCLK